MLNLNQLKKLYKNSPLWLQKLYASIPYDLRNGKEYRNWKNFLKKEISIDEYKLFKLKETILYAYENTEYYKQTFNELDISPFDIQTIKDVALLPIIDKNIVRENYDRLHVKNFPARNTFYVSTGGTSGEPMTFLQSENVWKKELAFSMNYFSKYGYKPSMLKASFRGGTFDNLPKNRYWKYNPLQNEMHFSPFHINEKNIEYYMKDLNTLKPKYFHSYPSSLLLFISQMKNKGLKLDYNPTAIILISENFTLKDIEQIKSFFNCDVSSFYGHTERLIFAPNYADDLSSYKIDDRYGFFELIDETDQAINENNKRGEMVGLSFDNLAMPLLRYRTNDFTHFIKHEQNIISMVEGRWTQEYLLGKDGLKLFLTALNMHSDIFENVIKYQFHQIQPANVELHVIVTKSFQENDKKNILKALKEKAGHAITFKIKITDQLKLTPRGKFKQIIKDFN